MRNLILILALALASTAFAAREGARLTAVIDGMRDGATAAPLRAEVVAAYVAQAPQAEVDTYAAAHPGLSGEDLRAALTATERDGLTLRLMRADMINRVGEQAAATEAPNAQQLILDARAAARARVRTAEDPAAVDLEVR